MNKRTLSVATLSYSSSEEPEDRQNRNIELKFKVLCSGGLYVPGPGWRGDLRRVADSRLPGRPGGPGCGNLKCGELG